MSRLAELRKKAEQYSEEFSKEVFKEKEGGNRYTDDRFWSLTADKAGNGAAEIRFLPGSSNDPLPWIKFWDHGFKGPTGKWYIEKSLTTIDQEDPVSQLNTRIWNGLDEFSSIPEKARQDLVRSRKRRLHYVSNVLVVNDLANPLNNGKVFLFSYGKKLFEKISDVMPTSNVKDGASGFADEPKFNPFDYWSGANFRYKAENKDGYRNYDKSGFLKPSVLGDDARLEEIEKSLHCLSELIKPENFKSYAELSMKLNSVLGIQGSSTAPTQNHSMSSVTLPSPTVDDTADDDDMSPEDVLAMFEKMAKENGN